MWRLLTLLFAITLFASCEKDETPDLEPIANLPLSNFSHVINNPFPPSEVEFTNASAFSTNYVWNFGDGNTSSEINPVHTYQTSGGFTVSLTASDDEGNTNIRTQLVSIQELPTRLLIKSLTIKHMPFTNQVNQPWDNNDGPDVYVSFQELSYDFILETETIDNIEEADLPVSWIWDSPYIDLVDIGHNFLIVFKEHDGPNIFAGMEVPILFDFDNYPNYPTIIEMTSPNGSFEIELEVVWQ